MTHVTYVGPMSCEHFLSVNVDKIMKRSRSRFTLVETTALVAIMALIVISAAPKFTARRLTANICSFPDFHHHAECLGTGKDQQVPANR